MPLHLIIGGCDEYSDYGFAVLAEHHTTDDVLKFVEETQVTVKQQVTTTASR